MPIKLNPCAKCGFTPTLWVPRCSKNLNGYAVSCECCSTQSVTGNTANDAKRKWNAANPKEGKPND